MIVRCYVLIFTGHNSQGVGLYKEVSHRSVKLRLVIVKEKNKKNSGHYVQTAMPKGMHQFRSTQKLWTLWQRSPHVTQCFIDLNEVSSSTQLSDWATKSRLNIRLIHKKEANYQTDPQKLHTVIRLIHRKYIQLSDWSTKSKHNYQTDPQQVNTIIWLIHKRHT